MTDSNRTTSNVFSESLNRSEKLLDQLLDLAKHISFDKGHKLHFHSIALYGSILEMASAILALGKLSRFTTVPIILRSQIEAYVDLINLITDPAYGHSLELEYAGFWRKILESARDSKNEYLLQLVGIDDVEGQIREFGRKERELRRKGATRLKRKDRFKSAQLQDVYFSVYSLLCSSSHNGLSALYERHAVLDEEGYRLTFFREVSDTEVSAHLQTALGVSLKASSMLHEYFETGQTENIDKLEQKFDEVFENSG